MVLLYTHNREIELTMNTFAINISDHGATMRLLYGYVVRQNISRPGSHELRHSNYCSNSKNYYDIFSSTTY